MQVPYLSASRTKLAEQCIRHYVYKYGSSNPDSVALKHKSQHRDNLQAAKVGTNVHNALEEWRRPNPETGRVRRPLYNKLIKLYDEECAKNEVDFDAYEDGRQMLERWFGERGSEKLKVLHVELPFGAHSAPYVLDNGVPVFGFIDLVFQHDDGSIELLDYKTQRKPILQPEADSDIQAGIYLAVASELFPDTPIRFTFDLTRYGTVTTTWTDDKIQRFKDWLKSKYEWLLAVDENDAPATIGDGCKWCAYVDICPSAQRLIHTGSWDLIVPDDIDEKSRNEQLDTLAGIKAAQSILAKKRQQMERMIREEWFEDTTSQDKVETDNWTVSFADRKRTEYIPSVVQGILDEGVFGQAVTLTKTAVDRVLPILPDEVAQAVNDSAIVKPYRTLTVRRKSDVD